MSQNKENRDRRQGRPPYFILLIIFLVLTLYAIGVQVTQIDLEEPLEPRRQENLVGLLRELADPELFDYENETRSTNISLLMPCPDEIRGSQVSVEDRVMVLAPNCASTTQDPLTISGEGFAANVEAVVRWYPVGVDLPRTLTTFRTDIDGSFDTTFTLPDVRPADEPQRVEVVERLSRRITGISPTTEETLERTLETILMALMASTLGTILAVPISFLGARNLMSGLGAPLASLMAALIALAAGYFIGSRVAGFLAGLTEFASDQPWLGLVVLMVMVAGLWAVFRFTLQSSDSATGNSRLAGYLRSAIIVVLVILALAVLAQLAVIVGLRLREALNIFTWRGIEFFGFIGYAIFVLADFLGVFLPALVGIAAAVVLATYTSRYAQELVLRLPEGSARTLTAALALVGTALLVYGLAYAVDWICLFGVCDILPEDTSSIRLALALPALGAGVVAALLSLLAKARRPFPVGIITYNVTRTILNTLRAIEPIIMGLVFVVWVGIGPFAGVLALVLHSIADLGKLFSEQVENIEEGPVEAVTATGASFLQKIVFSVVPQVVPHYTAFIFYRWDINVRMSTIIGLIGGGGIGLILFRSANLTQYRRAAVMIIAIAVVVTALDYISSKIRTRII